MRLQSGIEIMNENKNAIFGLSRPKKANHFDESTTEIVDVLVVPEAVKKLVFCENFSASNFIYRWLNSKNNDQT